MTQATKTAADRDRWSTWLEKYSARLKQEQESNPDLETLNQERVTLMNNTNPKYVAENMTDTFIILNCFQRNVILLQSSGLYEVP